MKGLNVKDCARNVQQNVQENPKSNASELESSCQPDNNSEINREPPNENSMSPTNTESPISSDD